MFPYFCWALIGTVMTIPLTLTCNILQGKSLWSNSFVEKGNYTFFGCIDQIFGIVETGPIDNGPLWYVRVLLLLFLISPLFMLVYKSSKLPILEVIIALILIVFFKSAYKFGDFELRLWAIPYFIIGMAAAKIDFWEKRIPVWLCILCGTCYVLFAVYESMVHISILKPYWILSYPWKVYCAIIFWAGLYDVCSKQADRIVKYIPMTFFIYCLHQPVLGYFRSFSRFFFCDSGTVLLLNCILSFLLTLTLCIFISKIFERICPKTYKFLIGGR